METRVLGWTGEKITTVGIGSFALGGNNWRYAWGSQDDADSIAAIRRGLDMGVNWVDTAPVYGFGHAEEVVGKAIAGRRKEVFLATKCGRSWKEGSIDPFPMLKAESVRREIDASLKRLGVDTIDLYQIHWPNPEEDIEEAWTVIAEAVKAGKIRYAGVSNFNVAQLKLAQAIHPVASLQPPYSMLRREIEAEILPYCREQKIGVVVYSPMQMGLLTGAFTKERLASLPADDLRTGNPFFQEPAFSATLELVEGLKPIAARLGISLAQLSLAWVLRNPEVTSAIVGARKPSQIEETAPASGVKLSSADAAEIEALLKKREAKLK
jgi:aryl-alcohol dehydrogenase-like predicted oxidoreductase